MAKVKLALSRRKVDDKITLGDTIGTSMAGKPTYPDPDTTLADYAVLTDDLRAKNIAYKAAAQNCKVLLAALFLSEDAWDAGTTTLGSYVQNKSGGDAGTIQEAGMSIKAPSLPIGPLGQVQNLSVTSGDDDGKLDFQWDREHGAKAFELQICPDRITPAGWKSTTPSTRSKKTVKNLPSGTRQWGRVRAIAGKEENNGPWSDPAVKTTP